MKGVYERIATINELVDKIDEVLEKERYMTNIINEFKITFYEDDTEDGGTRKGAGIKFFFHDSDIGTSLNILEAIKKVTGAEEIYFDVNEGDCIESIELFFYERKGGGE